jgi:hypothetical protein
MAGRRGLGDWLRDKLKITGSPRASKGLVANQAHTLPQPAQAASEPQRSSTTDSTELTNHIVPSKDLVSTSAEKATETEQRGFASLNTPNHTISTANRAPQGNDQASRIQDVHVQSAREIPGQTEIQHIDLWDRAYKMLRTRDKSLMEKYEKILDDELKASIASKAVFGAVTSVGMSVGLKGESKTPNVTDAATTLAVLGTPARQEQMKYLVQQKIKKYEDSAWKFKIGSKSVVVRDQTEKFVNTIMFAKSFVDSAVASDPHVALAWTGVCILLPVSVPFP